MHDEEEQDEKDRILLPSAARAYRIDDPDLPTKKSQSECLVMTMFLVR
jgi:hypothetical protein